MGFVGYAQLLEQLHGRSGMGSAFAKVLGSEHIVECRKRVYKVCLLKHHPDVPSAKAVQFGLPQGVETRTPYSHFAMLYPQQSTYEV
jgi:hypothetical protein